jgi:DNA-binding response OmpR family regulator
MTVRVLVVDDEPDVGMSSLDLLATAKTHHPDLPVFMISANDDPYTVAMVLARGADGFLTKPVDLPRLRQDIIAVMTDATGDNG